MEMTKKIERFRVTQSEEIFQELWKRYRDNFDISEWKCVEAIQEYAKWGEKAFRDALNQ